MPETIEQKRFLFVSLSMKDFTTRPNEEGLCEFAASTARGEGIAWMGDVMFHRVRSSGSLALTGLMAGTIWEFMRDQVHWKITSGTFDVSSDYVADLSGEPGILQLKNGSGTARGLTIEDRRDMSEAVVLPEASASGLTVDANARTIRIGKLPAAGGRVRAAYWPDRMSEGTRACASLPRNGRHTSRIISSSAAGLRIRDSSCRTSA